MRFFSLHRRVPSAHLPFPLLLFQSVMRRPMLPKHTLQQNSTLSIQMVISTLSLVARPPKTSVSPEPDCCWFAWAELDALRPPNSAAPKLFQIDEALAGAGTMSAFKPVNMREPVSPIAAENKNPAGVPSIRYHKNGLTRASVSDT